MWVHIHKCKHWPTPGNRSPCWFQYKQARRIHTLNVIALCVLYSFCKNPMYCLISCDLTHVCVCYCLSFQIWTTLYLSADWLDFALTRLKRHILLTFSALWHLAPAPLQEIYNHNGTENARWVCICLFCFFNHQLSGWLWPDKFVQIQLYAQFNLKKRACTWPEATQTLWRSWTSVKRAAQHH